MSRNSAFVKREKSLAEQIVIIIVVALLMAGFSYYFFKQEKQFSHIGFETVAGNFATKVSTIRAQWYMDKQPNVVLLKERQATEEIRKVPVNKRGWVDSISNENQCIAIWQYVMNSPLVFMNQPVAALQVNNMSEKNQENCRYLLTNGEYFQYNRTNGKVSNVLIHKGL